jgi:hypothetical protein
MLIFFWLNPGGGTPPTPPAGAARGGMIANTGTLMTR